MRRSPGTSMQRIRIPISAMNNPLAHNSYDRQLKDYTSPSLYYPGVLEAFGLDLDSLRGFINLKRGLFNNYEKN